jgi:hypothetical protein
MYFKPLSEKAELTVANCISDFEGQNGENLLEGVWDKRDMSPLPTTPQFWGLNTYACVAPSTGWDFTEDEILAIIINAIGLVVIVIELLWYFLKELHDEVVDDGDEEEDNGEYEGQA